jgi:hypothetical protein
VTTTVTLEEASNVDSVTYLAGRASFRASRSALLDPSPEFRYGATCGNAMRQGIGAVKLSEGDMTVTT